MLTQLIAVASAALFSAAMSFVLLKIVGAVFALKADDAEQSEGLDVTMHGEEAYVQSGGMDTHVSAGSAAVVTGLAPQTAR